MRNDARNLAGKGNFTASRIAHDAAEQIAQLEALFDAIRDQVEEGTYQYKLAELGLMTASRYSFEMAELSAKEAGPCITPSTSHPSSRPSRTSRPWPPALK